MTTFIHRPHFVFSLISMALFASFSPDLSAAPMVGNTYAKRTEYSSRYVAAKGTGATQKEACNNLNKALKGIVDTQAGLCHNTIMGVTVSTGTIFHNTFSAQYFPASQKCIETRDTVNYDSCVAVANPEVRPYQEEPSPVVKCDSGDTAVKQDGKDVCWRDANRADPEANRGIPESCGKGPAVDEHLLCGNPINVATGNKVQFEADFSGFGTGSLAFDRTYNSKALNNGYTGYHSYLGLQWTHSYSKEIRYSLLDRPRISPPDGTFKPWPSRAQVMRPDGKVLYFALDSIKTIQADSTVTTETIWADQLRDLHQVNRAFVDFDISVYPYKFMYHDANDAVETYESVGPDADGSIVARLVKIKQRTGLEENLAYNPNGTLNMIIDSFGQKLQFSYNSLGNIQSVSALTPAGAVAQTWSYTYNDSTNQLACATTGQSASNCLGGVTRPDNSKRWYTYEKNNLIYTRLLKITDENSKDFAFFEYAANNAVKSYHGSAANPINKFEVTQGAAAADNSRTNTVKDPDGTSTTWNIANKQGILRLGNRTGKAPCAGCGDRMQSQVLHTEFGKPVSSTNFLGSTTTFTYDTQGRETSRTEAVGTPVARTFETQWHPTFNLPTLRRSATTDEIMSYDPTTGLLQTRTLLDRSTGTSRVWQYAYNAKAQLTSLDGPLSGTADRTTYTYDANGNLLTITAPDNQITEYQNYDGLGRPALMIAPDGTRTAWTYNWRGQILTSTLTSAAGGNPRTVTHQTDNLGQRTKTTLADGSFVRYIYDDAHRLTDIQDNRGNRIHYTLDNAGRILSRETHDPAGQLAQLMVQYPLLARTQSNNPSNSQTNGIMTTFAQETL